MKISDFRKTFSGCRRGQPSTRRKRMKPSTLRNSCLASSRCKTISYEEDLMTILFTQHWDVIPGKFDEYSEFITNEYNPTLNRIGLKLLGGYYVAVGSGPRIVAVSTIEEKDYLRKILATTD